MTRCLLPLLLEEKRPVHAVRRLKLPLLFGAIDGEVGASVSLLRVADVISFQHFWLHNLFLLQPATDDYFMIRVRFVKFVFISGALI